ncbi:MAG: TlpA family protein disulfide reductase [Armatimonadetes bacterium]|nr:TlpA family protein disulfide reductase [Armatimonadota bacterium]
MKKIALALLATSIAGMSLAAAPELNKAVPAFKMTDLKGKVHTNKSLAGKVVLLDFWASWCGPCKKASPLMQKLHDKYAKKGLVVIGVNTSEEPGKSKATAASYAKEHKYTYNFTFENDALAKSWGVTGIPYFVLIDKKGVVRKIQTGFGGDDPFSATIDTLLK